MSKKPWEDKVSDEELEEVVDADFLDDEDEFEDYEEEDVTPSDEKREKGGGFINSSFLTVLLGLFFIIVDIYPVISISLPSSSCISRFTVSCEFSPILTCPPSRA